MNINTIKAIISSGERFIPKKNNEPEVELNTLELKINLQPRMVAHVISCFLNGKGGILLTGVSNEGEIIGLQKVLSQ